MSFISTSSSLLSADAAVIVIVFVTDVLVLLCSTLEIDEMG
jgi:hypothetical protein